jgi:hypothetical protein
MDNGTVSKSSLKIVVLTAFFVGVVVGMLAFDSVQDKEVQTKIEYQTKVEYKTIEVPVKTTEYITIKVPTPTYIKDTVYLEKTLPLNNYTGIERTIFGNLHYDITTAGYLTSTKFKPDFLVNVSVPTITNSIRQTNTIIKKPTGLFLTVGYQNNNINVGGVFVKDKVLVGLNSSGFSLGYKLR